jgi:hypothetical protein
MSAEWSPSPGSPDRRLLWLGFRHVTVFNCSVSRIMIPSAWQALNGVERRWGSGSPFVSWDARGPAPVHAARVGAEDSDWPSINSVVGGHCLEFTFSWGFRLPCIYCTCRERVDRSEAVVEIPRKQLGIGRGRGRLMDWWFSLPAVILWWARGCIPHH